MRISFLTNSISLGGGELIISTLAHSFTELGHSVVLIAWDSKILNQMNIIKTPEISIKITNNEPLKPLSKINCIRDISYILKKEKIDILIAFNITYAEYGLLACFLSKTPILISERVDPSILPRSILHRLFRPLVYFLADGRVFQTIKVKEYYSRFKILDSIVIANPIMYESLPDIVINKNYRKEIVAVGRLEKEKNFEMLINAFSKIANFYLDYQLIIYGSGELYDSLNGLVEKLNLKSRVKLYGRVQNIIKYIKGADIFVLSSNHEGMPNALIEAMAMGLACISTNVNSGGAAELIEHRVNGILIPVGDQQQLEFQLKFLIENESKKEVIKTNALKIRDSNNKENIINQWINYIKTIVEESKKNEK